MKESYILFVLERHEPKVTCWTITLLGPVLPGVSSACWPKCRTIVETSRRLSIHCSHVSVLEHCSFLAAGCSFIFIRQAVTSYLAKTAVFSTAKSLGPFHYTVVRHCISKSPCAKSVFNKQLYKYIISLLTCKNATLGSFSYYQPTISPLQVLYI